MFYRLDYASRYFNDIGLCRSIDLTLWRAIYETVFVKYIKHSLLSNIYLL